MPRFEFPAVKLPPQLHASSLQWSGEFVAMPLDDDPVGHKFKPMFGFWTSSDRGDGETAWLDLCRDPARDEISAIEVHRLEVIGEPRIWILREDQQLIDAAIELGLLHDYREQPDWRLYEGGDVAGDLDYYIKQRMEVLLDYGEFWGKFRHYADAVHVPSIAKFGGPWLGEFEVESTCWFEPGKHLRQVSRQPWPY